MVGGCTSLCTKCACVSSWHHAVGVVVVVFVAAAEVAVAVAVVVVVVVGATTAANQETKARKTSSYDEKLAQNPPPIRSTKVQVLVGGITPQNQPMQQLLT